jgi:hypothetical protein
MTDAPVDLDDAFEKLHAELFTLKGYGLLDALIAELRAARAPVEAEASWQVAWERVCPEAARSARLGWFDGKNKREGFEAGYLAAQSRAAPPADASACYCSDYLSSGMPCPPGKCPNVPKPPADEVAGLLASDLETVRDALNTLAVARRRVGTDVESTALERAALDRIENHLKGKR